MNLHTNQRPGRPSLQNQAEALMTEGFGREAVDLLTAAVEELPDPALERFLVQVRHRAAVASIEGGCDLDGDWPPQRPDPFDEAGVPEVRGTALTPDLLAAALQHRGCLLVRELFAPDVAERLRADVVRSVDASQAAAGTSDDASPWYAPFQAEPGYSFGAMERQFTRNLGGVLTVEAPRPLVHTLQAFRAIGFGELLTSYLGEWPMLSAKKSTLRRAQPTSPTEWHQDGAFLGTRSRTVNAWVALSSCGVDAPGIDVFPQAFDHIVATGTDSALFDWSVSPEEAARIGTEPERPAFEPGDALLFNQLTLHRSAVDPSMTEDRYAIESWFFAPSQFPYEQVPILF